MSRKFFGLPVTQNNILYILFFDRRPDTEGTMWPSLVYIQLNKGTVEKYSILLSDTPNSN
jgi:hypothetical protein